jgi:hypothetical protein
LAAVEMEVFLCLIDKLELLYYTGKRIGSVYDTGNNAII